MDNGQPKNKTKNIQFKIYFNRNAHDVQTLTFTTNNDRVSSGLSVLLASKRINHAYSFSGARHDLIDWNAKANDTPSVTRFYDPVQNNVLWNVFRTIFREVLLICYSYIKQLFVNLSCSINQQCMTVYTRNNNLRKRIYLVTIIWAFRSVIVWNVKAK